MLLLYISIATIIALSISKSGAITNLTEMACSYFNSPQFVLSSFVENAKYVKHMQRH